ncbi:hypothetical protein [Streptomyces sp. NPDC007088]|uniref:hypothetical protein n=1 Tax=Streptomyces sp. NPDC007088 TaxID=3364773 RepID=UPI003697BB9E
MRPAQTPPGPSPTPIYDALYAEYRKLFRTVPGDRGGEDELGLPLFGSQGQGLSRSSHAAGRYGPGAPGAAPRAASGAHRGPSDTESGHGSPAAPGPHTGYGWGQQPAPQPGWPRRSGPRAALPPAPRGGQ